MASRVTKIFTGYAGLPVCAEPQKELLKYYNKLSRALKKLPEDYKYRTSTEQMIKERTAVIESTLERDEAERRIGAGLFEEMIEQAKHELKLTSVLEKCKPWEPAEEKPDEAQWKWPQ